MSFVDFSPSRFNMVVVPGKFGLRIQLLWQAAWPCDVLTLACRIVPPVRNKMCVQSYLFAGPFKFIALPRQLSWESVRLKI